MGSEYNSAYAKSSNTVASSTDATSVPTVLNRCRNRSELGGLRLPLPGDHEVTAEIVN